VRESWRLDGVVENLCWVGWLGGGSSSLGWWFRGEACLKEVLVVWGKEGVDKCYHTGDREGE